jgi:hypothetical protein
VTRTQSRRWIVERVSRDHGGQEVRERIDGATFQLPRGMEPPVVEKLAADATPVIAVILGWRFLGERPTSPMLVGTALVIGSVVAVWRLSSRPPPSERAAITDQA